MRLVRPLQRGSVPRPRQQGPAGFALSAPVTLPAATKRRRPSPSALQPLRSLIHAKIPPSVLIDYFSELEYIPFKASPKNLHIPFESRHALL